ncbi:uncharacterized protein LDX57_000631 [Aspergillus melleus]|uniref:uncharacterized protein n=1 Tax=Aspergillus melleus TaxID=138277 RepID=UPI001E8E0AD2|nr:uncharacterized protein LDX57_000631 [Aspergillus melleus]KAH8422878.1 hypothetical protein LDX57_000631 [Aspergillus melleus]
MGQMYRDRYCKSSVFSALSFLEPLVTRHGLTLVEVALRWCVHHSALRVTDGQHGVITGFSSLGQLESNLEDLEKGPLPEELVEALDQAWYMTKADAARFWHGELVYQYDMQKVLFGN